MPGLAAADWRMAVGLPRGSRIFPQGQAFFFHAVVMTNSGSLAGQGPVSAKTGRARCPRTARRNGAGWNPVRSAWPKAVSMMRRNGRGRRDRSPGRSRPGAGCADRRGRAWHRTGDWPACFMGWYPIHMAARIRRASGIPARGKQRSRRDGGSRFDHPDPEFRRPRPVAAFVAASSEAFQSQSLRLGHVSWPPCSACRGSCESNE